MKLKITHLLSSFFVCGYLNAQITSPSPYCASTFDNNYNMINYLSVKGTKADLGPMGSWMSTNTYLYYNTTAFPSLSKGDTSTIKIQFYSPGDMEPIYFAVWIDYNQSNTFESTELVMQNSNTIAAALPTFGAPIGIITKSITVPATATSGTTRMRIIRGSDPSNPFAPYSPSFSLSPCPVSLGSTYGCTYDFNVNIVNSSTVNVEEMTDEMISVYPNPAKETLYMNIDQANWLETKVFGMDGKEVLMGYNPNKHILDVSTLTPGIYVLSIRMSNGKLYRSRFLKQ